MIAQDGLEKLLKSEGVPLFRARQVMHAIYKEGISDYESCTTLPPSLRMFIKKSAPVFSFSVERKITSTNGKTVKSLFKMSDGKLVEGVLMRFRDGRDSVCVSSQVGCGLKCGFCATGTMGFIRHLTYEEIADQVLYFDHYLKKHSSRVSNVIFMGMGEPLLNLDHVLRSIRILNDANCLGIAARSITVSTAGIVPGILKLADFDLQINLAVSLHAPNQALREKLMPIARAYTLPKLMEAIATYVQKTHRRISYEYVMLRNINDSEQSARELGKLIKGQRCHVNLIPYNETYLGYSNAGKTRIDRFRRIVESFSIPVTVRVSLGQDISAACGQLAVKETISRSPCSRH